jgi:hypothetical protein
MLDAIYVILYYVNCISQIPRALILILRLYNVLLLGLEDVANSMVHYSSEADS